MKDASFTLTKALPNSGGSNNTDSRNLNISDFRSNQFRLMHWEISIPALADHTDPTKTVALTLQDSADGLSFANTNPLVEVEIAGVASTGSAAFIAKEKLPPGVQTWVRWVQTVPAGAGNGSNATITYDIVV